MEKDGLAKSSDTSIEKEGFISQSLSKDGISNQSLPDDHIGQALPLYFRNILQVETFQIESEIRLS